MSSLQRFFNPSVRLFDTNIKSLPGAKLHFYKAGMGAGNPKATYQDKAGNIAHANPVVADSTGTFAPIFLSGLYKVELKNSAGVTQAGWPIDNVGQDTIISPFAPWSEIVTYNTDDVVTSPTGNWYRSLIDNNLGDDPDDASGDWALIVIPVAANFVSNVDWIEFADSGSQLAINVNEDNFADYLGKSKFKAALESRSSTSVLTADSELAGVELDTGYYEVSGYLEVTCSSDTPDFKFGFVYSGGTISTQGVVGTWTSDSSTGTEGVGYTGVRATSMTIDMTAFERINVTFSGVVHVSAGPTTASLVWAQQVPNVSAISVQAGSFLRYTKIG